MDLLSSDLALRCGDRGEAEASGRGAVGASLGRSCGREQPPVSTSVPLGRELWEVRTAGACSQVTGMLHLCWAGREACLRDSHPGPATLPPEVGSETPWLRFRAASCFRCTSHRHSLLPPRPLLLGVTGGRALSSVAASGAAGHLRSPERTWGGR